MRTDRTERGLTLVEVTVALVLASLVLVGLVGFYLSSQMTWVTSSTKTLTQRSGTLALEEIASRVRASTSALAQATPDADHMQLFLYGPGGGAPTWRFWWEPSDSMLHFGTGAATDLGPLITSRVSRFRVTVSGGSLVEIGSLRVLSPGGDEIELTSAAALYNRP